MSQTEYIPKINTNNQSLQQKSQDVISSVQNQSTSTLYSISNRVQDSQLLKATIGQFQSKKEVNSSASKKDVTFSAALLKKSQERKASSDEQSTCDSTESQKLLENSKYSEQIKKEELNNLSKEYLAEQYIEKVRKGNKSKENSRQQRKITKNQLEDLEHKVQHYDKVIRQLKIELDKKQQDRDAINKAQEAKNANTYGCTNIFQHLMLLKKRILNIVLPKSTLVLYQIGSVWDRNIRSDNPLKLPTEIISLGGSIKQTNAKIREVLIYVRESYKRMWEELNEMSQQLKSMQTVIDETQNNSSVKAIVDTLMLQDDVFVVDQEQLNEDIDLQSLDFITVNQSLLNPQQKYLLCNTGLLNIQ